MNLSATSPSDMLDGLAEYCRHLYPDREGLRIHSLSQASAGWESEIWSFCLEYGPGVEHRQEDLILRLYPGNDAQAKSAREFEGISHLHEAGYPVPAVFALERDDSPFGRPFILMERISGSHMWHALDRASEEKQQELLTLFCRLLVTLHRLDWRPFVPDQRDCDLSNPYIFVDRMLASWASFPPLAGHAECARGLEWLAARRAEVPCTRPAVIHWDYHPANILLRQDDGAPFVIDWTQIEVSDARYDLAWTLMLMGSMNPRHYDLVLHEYERQSGECLEAMAWFEVAACLKRLYTVILALGGGAGTLGMRPGAEAQMRAHAGPLRNIYTALAARTEMAFPQIESFLARL